MILESVTILYYSLATISIGIVLYQKYNTNIHTFINKWLYNYQSVPNEEEFDLNVSDNLNNDNTYLLFNDYNESNNNESNNNELNNNELNNNELNNNELNNNLTVKTKKNILIYFK